MFRTVCAAIAAVVMVNPVAAGEVTGKLKNVDAANGKITIVVDDKEQAIQVGADTKFRTPDGKALKNGLENKNFKKGQEVQVVANDDGVAEEIVLKTKQEMQGAKGKLRKADGKKPKKG